MGLAAAERLFNKYKTPYEVGNSFEVLCKITNLFKFSNNLEIGIFLDQTSGASPDHMLGQYKVPFAYTIEMRDTGR